MEDFAGIVGKTVYHNREETIIVGFSSGSKRGCRFRIHLWDNVNHRRLGGGIDGRNGGLMYGECSEIDKGHCQVQVDHQYNVLVPDSLECLNLYIYPLDQVTWVDGWPVPISEGSQ